MSYFYRNFLFKKSLLEPLAKGDFDESEHPRDSNGRFTDGVSSEELKTKGIKVDKQGRYHVGDHLKTAIKLLAQGKQVVLKQPRQLSTLMDKLAEIGNEAKKLGLKAPLYNLCNVSVPGTNLFCADSIGVPRAKMPQLSGKPIKGSKADSLPKNDKGEVNLADEFRAHLNAKGYQIEDTNEAAAYLRASQNELNGTKVGGMANAFEAGKLTEARIFVSEDNYIIDGHHRWGAQVSVGYEKGKDISMQVSRINADIGTLLDEANKFAKKWGIAQRAAKVEKTECGCGG